MAFSLEQAAQLGKRRQHMVDIMVVRQEWLLLADQDLIDDIIRQATVDMYNRRQDLITGNLAGR